jgi:hypothetical protein
VKIFLSISLISLFIKISTSHGLCEEVEDEVLVTKGFQWKQYAVLFTAKSGVFHFKDLKNTGNELTYESVDKWENWFAKYKQLEKITTIFATALRWI